MLGEAKIHCAAALELFLSIIVTIVIQGRRVLSININIIEFIKNRSKSINQKSPRDRYAREAIECM
jgi:hypothetical protein